MQLCLLAYPEIMAVSEKRDDGFWYHKQWGRMSVPAKYTASIDAAVALVEKVWVKDYWSIDAFNQATVGDGDRFQWRGNGRTPALALIAALLRALIAQEKP